MAFPVLLISGKKKEKESYIGSFLEDLTESFSGSSHEHAFVIGDPVTRPPSAAVSIPETEIRRRTCRGADAGPERSRGGRLVCVPARRAQVSFQQPEL